MAKLRTKQIFPLLVKRCQELTGIQTPNNQQIAGCIFKQTGEYLERSYLSLIKNDDCALKQKQAEIFAQFLGLPITEFDIFTITGKQAPKVAKTETPKRPPLPLTGWHRPENQFFFEPRKTDIEIVEIERRMRGCK